MFSRHCPIAAVKGKMGRKQSEQLAIPLLQMYLGSDLAGLVVDALKESQERFWNIATYLRDSLSVDTSKQLIESLKHVAALGVPHLRSFISFLYQNVVFHSTKSGSNLSFGSSGG